MLRTFSPILLLLLAFLQGKASNAALIGDREHICGPYYASKKTFQIGKYFNQNDRLLICGSDETPGWETVPESQALFHLRTILSAQGYFSLNISKDGDQVVIDPGKQSRIKKIVFTNDPPGFKDRIFRGIEDKALTPGNIEKAKDWSISRLRSMGFPCPTVNVRAGYDNEILEIDISAGPRQNLIEVIRPDTPELHQDVYIRNDAFQVNRQFNADLLNLSSRRLVESGIAQFSHFTDRCGDIGAHAKQNVVLGKPRTLIFALGASTEELPIFKTEWKHSRLDDFGSNVTAALYASPRLQSLRTSADLYWFRGYPELFILPVIELRRETEPTYKIFAQNFRLGLGHINDDSRHRYSFKYSPVYTIEDTIEGEGPGRIDYFSFETEFNLLSHYFEFYKTAPQEGYDLNARWRAQRDGFGSPISADILDFTGTYLVNLGTFDPPLTVLGLRFGHSVLLASDLDLTPTSFRLFLGGAEDVRGFSRKSINNANRGYRTASYLGLEGRFLEILPWQLQPYVFVDAAKVGEERWEWNDSSYISPGVGMRWQSPIGALRGSIARGMIDNKDMTRPQPKEEWNFYLSYGQEF